MSSKVVVGIMIEKAQAYWRASRQWRGDQQYGAITIGELLDTVADLAGDLNHLGWRRAEERAASLLQQVTSNKRNRKRKLPNNVVSFNERKAFKAQALLQEMRGDPQALVGLQITMNIKAG